MQMAGYRAWRLSWRQGQHEALETSQHSAKGLQEPSEVV